VIGYSRERKSRLSLVEVGGVEPQTQKHLIAINAITYGTAQELQAALQAPSVQGKIDETLPIAVELRAVIDAWPELPKAMRAGILAMVMASKQHEDT
jgi:hypothetical protein